MIIKARGWGENLDENARSKTRKIVYLWNILPKPVGSE